VGGWGNMNDRFLIENDRSCSPDTHSLPSIKAKHQTTRLYQPTQRLRDTRQEQDRVINTTTLYLSSFAPLFSPHISLLDEWQSSSRITRFFTLQPWAPRVQRDLMSSRPETGTSLYRARTVHCKKTAQASIKSLLERHMLDRSYRFMNGTLSHSIISAARSRCVVGERFSPPEGFVRSIHVT